MRVLVCAFLGPITLSYETLAGELPAWAVGHWKAESVLLDSRSFGFDAFVDKAKRAIPAMRVTIDEHRFHAEHQIDFVVRDAKIIEAEELGVRRPYLDDTLSLFEYGMEHGVDVEKKLPGIGIRFGKSCRTTQVSTLLIPAHSMPSFCDRILSVYKFGDGDERILIEGLYSHAWWIYRRSGAEGLGLNRQK